MSTLQGGVVVGALPPFFLCSKNRVDLFIAIVTIVVDIIR